jgi:hypothetical protein
VLRVAQTERRFIVADLHKHRLGCFMCSSTRPDCPTGKALQEHLSRATLQIEMLKRPNEDQLPLEEFADE